MVFDEEEKLNCCQTPAQSRGFWKHRFTLVRNEAWLFLAPPSAGQGRPPTTRSTPKTCRRGLHRERFRSVLFPQPDKQRLPLPRPPFYVSPASANLSPPALSSLGATGLSTPRHLPWLGTWPSTLEPLPPTSGPWSQTTCRCPQRGLCPPSGSCVLSCFLSSILLMAPRAFEIWI